jgi:hypothetical protein
MTAPATITKKERDSMTDAACELFKVRNPDFWPSKVNAEKLVGFVERNLGMSLADYPYPVTINVWQDCYDYLLQHDFFYARPEEEPQPEDPAVVKERQTQERVRTDYDARQAAEKRQRDRNMPLSELGKVVSVQNAQLREIRETSGLPFRATGMESRHVEQVNLGIPAQARVNVGLANPGLDTHSAEFTKKCAAEMARLRG